MSDKSIPEKKPEPPPPPKATDQVPNPNNSDPRANRKPVHHEVTVVEEVGVKES